MIPIKIWNECEQTYNECKQEFISFRNKKVKNKLIANRNKSMINYKYIIFIFLFI